MSRLFYLAAGSKKWGIGHLKRSVELINRLRRNNIDVQAVAVIPDLQGRERLSSLMNVYDEGVLALEQIPPFHADGIVVDVNEDFQPRLFNWLQERKIPVFALDWYFNESGLIRGRVNLRGGARALQHAVIREEFREAAARDRPAEKKYDAVIVMGAVDARGHLLRIFEMFSTQKEIAGRRGLMILSPTYEGRLDSRVGHQTGNLSVARDPDHLANLMASARIGITNGGTTLMEFTMLGIPTLVYPQSEQEDHFARTFIARGTSRWGSLDPDVFARQIEELLRNDTVRKEMALKTKMLIDGRGAQRIVKRIVETLLEKKEKVSYGE